MYTKRKYRNIFNVVKLNEVDKMKYENFKKDDIGIFVVGNDRDFYVFTRFYICFKNRIIICSENQMISKKYTHLVKESFLDISKPKFFFTDDLTSRIKHFLNS